MNLNILKGSIYTKFKNQKAFADAIGWHPNKVTRLVQGQFTPDVNQAAEISRVLNLSSDVHLQIFLPTQSPNGDKEV